jgi:signal transduction histidine kinase
LEITVDDAGPGIAPADRERVFDKFVQLDPSQPGTGLGLFISRAIVESLGGEVSIGESPAGGCRVCLRLPIPDVG